MAADSSRREGRLKLRIDHHIIKEAKVQDSTQAIVISRTNRSVGPFPVFLDIKSPTGGEYH